MQTEGSGFALVKQPTATRLGKEKRLHGCDERSMGNNGILGARFVKSESSRPSSEAREDAR